mgnify:CR=1 FL=1
MITEDNLRRCILKGIDIVKFILFKILYIQVALIVVLLWAITYGIIYAATGFHAHNGAIYAAFILALYPAYVIIKNSVSFYKWLYQK